MMELVQIQLVYGVLINMCLPLTSTRRPEKYFYILAGKGSGGLYAMIKRWSHISHCRS